MLCLPVTESQFFKDFSLKVDHVLKHLLALLSRLTCSEGKEFNLAELVYTVEASSGSSRPTGLGSETVTKGDVPEAKEGGR